MNRDIKEEKHYYTMQNPLLERSSTYKNMQPKDLSLAYSPGVAERVWKLQKRCQ
jgi:malic enzyme